MEKCDEAETTEKYVVWEALKSIICNNIDYYANDESTNGLKLHAAFLGIIDQLEEARPLLDSIELFCKDYDYDEQTPGNGYRSFIKVFDAAINHASKIIKHVTENRSSLLFRKNNYTKEVEACNHMLGSLITLLHHLETLHSMSEDGGLFPVQEQTVEEILERSKTVNQFAFYGRCLGFHYCDSIKPVLKFIAISMASFSESYYSTNGRFIKATNSMFTSGKYLFDPEMMSRRIVNLSNTSQVDFCKSFWFLTENEIMNTISLVSHGVKVNRLMKITTEALKMSTSNGDEIEIPGVGQIKVRLLSAHKREGMVGDKRNKSGKKEEKLPKSKALMLHVHGGGFVSQSSKSHLVYLNEWANALNVPIFSIDYSLAPESPYPRALNEVFYAYCWALKNCELLGSTCEKVVFVGDSAGANICLAALLKCIDMKIRKPDGIFIAYCPVLVGFDPSPSRLLCMMDPLLPFGFMMRCLKAYSHSKEDYADDEKKQLQKLEEMKRAKADRNEELKRKASNPDCDQEMVFSEDEKSDSFEEISCFERHQTDSNLQAHISQVSDGASNDTLAGASFLTGTDNKNSNVNNTIEIISPIDSIRSATSLEEDSLPITIQKNDKRASAEDFADIDLPPSTSHHSDEITHSNRKYVDDFIEKYVLDAEQNDDGFVKPILRKASHTRSEENIVFDISRDALSVQNFQEKVQRVASSLVDTVSSTITQITTSNRPIIRNFSSDIAADEIRMLNNGSVPTSPTADFIFSVPKDPFLSPLFADDDVLVQFPSIKIVTLSLDPFFDDNIFFAKKLRDLNIDVQLDILDGLPHGFLNFSRLSKDAHEASKLSMARIADLFHITLDQDETKVKYFC